MERNHRFEETPIDRWVDFGRAGLTPRSKTAAEREEAVEWTGMECHGR